MKIRPLPCLLAVLSFGCASENNAPLNVNTGIPTSNMTKQKETTTMTRLIYKYQGSVQCFKDSGVDLNTMHRELSDSGINVICAATGHDGRLYPQVCGGKTGKINVYKINTDQVALAESLGFESLDSLTGAIVDVDCTS